MENIFFLLQLFNLKSYGTRKEANTSTEVYGGPWLEVTSKET
jgi:hypothetical protein